MVDVIINLHSLILQWGIHSSDYHYEFIVNCTTYQGYSCSGGYNDSLT